MEQKDNRVHFRKTLYFKMVVVTVFLGFTFFLALGFIYQLSTERFRKEMTAQSDALTDLPECRNCFKGTGGKNSTLSDHK